jgi:Immunoglobulin domain/Immunoglobulin I-set domain
MMHRLHKPALLLAALLQVLPFLRNFVASPAVANGFAFILRWGIATGAALESVDAVSGATSVFTTPATFSGTVGNVFSNKVSCTIGGGNTASSSDYFQVAGGGTTSPTIANGASSTVGLPAGLKFTSSWVNNSSVIGGYISGTPTTAGSYPITVTVVSPGNASLAQAITITISGSTGPTAPAITTPPAAATVAQGKTATFTVTASGTAPLTYAWLKNGTALADGGNISGSATATLSLANISSADAANYSVTVGNTAGSVTSAAAALTVVVPPAITAQPAAVTQSVGTSANFSVTATGSAPLAYQWQKNGAAVANGTKYSGATTASLTVAALATADAGNFSVVIGNSAGSVTSSVAPLTVVSAPSITTQPANISVVSGGSASFTVAAAGSAPLTYQWLKGGSPLANGGNISGATTATLTVSPATSADAAGYSVTVSNALGTATSTAATLTVAVPPAIVTAPASATVIAGSNISFTVTASGTAPLAYQWLKNNSAIAGATSATLTLNNVTSANAANYSVTVTNAVGSVTSAAATLTVLVPPAITTQPASISVAQGNAATFTAAASGTAPLSFQWLKNGAPIAGANSNVLSLAAVTANDAANYSVVVTNIVGSIASSSATLTVLVPPAIVTAPAAATVLAGGSATFTVTASGTAPLTYQWLKNNSAIAGATSATLALNNVASADAANYSVTVVNAAGSVTSAAAALTVNSPPSITTQPANQFGAVGSSISLSVVAAGTGPLSYQWFNSTGALADGGNISGSATATLAITSLTANEVGNYFVVVSNAFGSATSATVSITVNVPASITGQPASQTVTTGGSASFSVTASGSGTLAYQWFKNGTKIANGTGVSGATAATLSLTGVTTNSAGSYTVTVTNLYGSATSAAATLTVQTPPVITAQPAGRSVATGSNVTFTVTASGTAPLNFQWLKNGTALADGGNISGSATAVLTVSGVTTNDAGSYSVAVSNPVGSTNSAAVLAVITPTAAPVILTQPASQTIAVSATASFSVAASGNALRYQWFKNGKKITGATNFLYSIANAQTNASGNYFVNVTNSAGGATSATAVLTVAPLPVFAAQPASHKATNGLTTKFTVKVKGPVSAVSFQWLKNGTPLADGASISGSQTSTLTISQLSFNDAGAYAVRVSNRAGSVTSSNALLIVVGHHSGGDNGNDNVVSLKKLLSLKAKPVAKVNALAGVIIVTPATPAIANLAFNSDSSVTLTGTAPAGSNCVVQASSDLSAWTSIVTNTADNHGQWSATDNSAAAQPVRFYRAVVP